jgi:hypothetical protein
MGDGIEIIPENLQSEDSSVDASYADAAEGDSDSSTDTEEYTTDKYETTEAPDSVWVVNGVPQPEGYVHPYDKWRLDFAKEFYGVNGPGDDVDTAKSLGMFNDEVLKKVRTNLVKAKNTQEAT